jgi:hypothetical protein
MTRVRVNNQRVVDRFANKSEAAVKLAKLSRVGQDIANEPAPTGQGTVGYTAWTELKANFKPELTENDSAWKNGHIAHTKPNGSISIAIRDKSGEFLPEDRVMFVYLHELAHVATFNMSRDKHSTEFWAAFGGILDVAYKKGLLTPREYSKDPDTYEGIHIEYNPWYEHDWLDILKLPYNGM